MRLILSPFSRSSDHPKEQHNGNKVSIMNFSSRYEIVNFLLISSISQKVHCYKIPDPCQCSVFLPCVWGQILPISKQYKVLMRNRL